MLQRGIAWLTDTTGEIIFGKISSFFKDDGLHMELVCMLVADGAP